MARRPVKERDRQRQRSRPARHARQRQCRISRLLDRQRFGFYDRTIIITSPDGIGSVTINGILYTGAGQVITTSRGTLTLGALTATNEIGYTYRLTDNTSGEATTDLFTVIVTDTDGDTSTATLTIEIADDVPTARNDTDTVAGGTYGPESGNVLTGSWHDQRTPGADTQGADGAAISGFRAGNAGDFAAVGATINGQYGTLTLGANGTYTYVRNTNTPGGVSDVFSYRLADGDGDTSTATLTINIGDAARDITFVPEIGEGTRGPRTAPACARDRTGRFAVRRQPRDDCRHDHLCLARRRGKCDDRRGDDHSGCLAAAGLHRCDRSPGDP